MFDLLQSGLDSIRSDGLKKTIIKFYEFILFANIFKYVISPLGKKLDIQSNIILFGTHNGRSYGSVNTKYVFEWLVEHRSDLNPIWIADNTEVYNELYFKDLPVEMASTLTGAFLLTQAELGVITHGLGDIAEKKSMVPEELPILYLNHGIPVKYGRKMERSESEYKKRERLNYQICCSEFHGRVACNRFPNTDQKFLVTGFPRNDVLFDSTVDQSDLDNKTGKDSTIILYAPTKRRKRRWEMPTQLFPFDDFDIEQLDDFLEAMDIVLLINLHPSDMRQLDDPELKAWNQSLIHRLESLLSCNRIKLTSDDKFIETHSLLSISDILITDYSAIYHDFLLLDRPIIFFPYDYEQFEKQVGFNYDYFGNLPGPAIKTFEQFQKHLNQLLDEGDPYVSERRELRNKLHKHADSDSTKRVVEAIDDIRNDQKIESIDVFNYTND